MVVALRRPGSEQSQGWAGSPPLIRVSSSSAPPLPPRCSQCALCWDRTRAGELQTSQPGHRRSRSKTKADVFLRALGQGSATHPVQVPLWPGLVPLLGRPYCRPPTWVQRARTGKCTGSNGRQGQVGRPGQCLSRVFLSERLGLSISLVFWVEVGNSKPHIL